LSEEENTDTQLVLAFSDAMMPASQACPISHESKWAKNKKPARCALHHCPELVQKYCKWTKRRERMA